MGTINPFDQFCFGMRQLPTLDNLYPGTKTIPMVPVRDVRDYEMKVCDRCLFPKIITAFAISKKTNKNGFIAYRKLCKKCYNETRRVIKGK